METKNKKEKLPYIAPDITVVNILTQDIITTSTVGNDGVDNWLDDNFIIE